MSAGTLVVAAIPRRHQPDLNDTRHSSIKYLDKLLKDGLVLCVARVRVTKIEVLRDVPVMKERRRSIEKVVGKRAVWA